MDDSGASLNAAAALDGRSEDRDRLRRRVRALLLARVLVVTFFLGATALAAIGSDSDRAYPTGAVAAVLVLAYAASIASALSLEGAAHLRAFAFVQIAVDLCLITAAIPLTGGLQSPMAVWYNLAIIAGSILLPPRGGYTAAALASLTYGVLMNLLYHGAWPAEWIYPEPVRHAGLGFVYQILANVGSFFSIAYLASFLVARLEATEEALERSESDRQRIETVQQALVAHLESGVFTADPAGVIQSANQALETILGIPASEVVGRRISEVFPVLKPPGGAKAMLDPSPIPLEFLHRRGDGAEEQILRSASAPLTDTYGNLIGTLFILQDVTSIRKLEDEVERGAAELPVAELPKAPAPAITGILGSSPPVLQVAEVIRRAAPTDSTVLVTGESGTGKELVARAIHAMSHRRDKPMVVVNCGAIPENLIESELFGHVRGAFTGAVGDRRGLFRAADGGTVFLDEVGDLPLPMQVKLLRVLQERSFAPVGGENQVVVNVRIIAATNRSLEAEVRAGNFREDLFYRLNVIRLEMPPLRDRSSDLPLLIQHFIERFSETLKRPVAKLSGAAAKRLLAYSYPGNIRELENVIEHAVALCDGDTIREQDLPAKLHDDAAAEHHSHQAASPATPGEPLAVARTEASLEAMLVRGANLDEELEAIERRLLEEALKRASGVRKRAAEILGINYRSLRHRLSKYGFGDGETKEGIEP